MVKYENFTQKVLQSMEYDLSRGWIRRKVAEGWTYSGIREFCSSSDEDVERKLEDAVHMGFISSLSSVEGITLLQKWQKIVNEVELDSKKVVKRMEWSKYKEGAIKTMNGGLSTSEALQNMAYGLIGEVGEVVDLLKKVKFHGHKTTREFDDKLIKEIGDVCWYSAVLQSIIKDVTSFKSNLPEFSPKKHKTLSGNTNDIVLFLTNEVQYITKGLFSVAVKLDFVDSRPDKHLALELESTREKLAHIYIAVNRVLYACVDLITIWVNSYSINYAFYENNKKLLARYGDSFSVTKSVNRENV